MLSWHAQTVHCMLNALSHTRGAWLPWTDLAEVSTMEDVQAGVVSDSVLQLLAALRALDQLSVLHNPHRLVHLHVALLVCMAAHSLKPPRLRLMALLMLI